MSAAEGPAAGKAPADEGQGLVTRLRAAKGCLGSSRLEIGAALAVIYDNGLWRGRAHSWPAFLASEHIPVPAARQFMDVARAFVLNSATAPAREIERLALCAASMRVLKLASKVVTPTNRARVYGIIEALAEVDAMEALREIQHAAEDAGALAPSGKGRRRDARVSGLLNAYFDLPMELRIEVIQGLKLGRQDGVSRAESSPPHAPA